VKAILTAVRAAVTRRKLQTFIIGSVVLLSTATGVLAVGLLIASHAPFESAFSRAQGAHVAAIFAGRTPEADLTRTATASGVQAAVGPFGEVTAAMQAAAGFRLPNATVVARTEQNGPVDKLSLDSGSWLSGPGQIVLSRQYAGPLADSVGSEVTLDTPDHPTLRLVGIADSITSTADGWVWPGTVATTGWQMLYRFDRADTADDLSASLDTATSSLPDGALVGSSTYLAVRTEAERGIAPFVPFVVAFAILGLVLAVLISANVVSGAVIAGTRTIGVLKSLGFTPGQVVGAYVGQVVLPAVVGCLAGSVVGVLLAVPVLAQTGRAYNLPNSTTDVPVWTVILVALAAPVVVTLAATGPALRAGRMAANQAITVGRSPRTGRGYRVRRALAATRLPRSAALGLGLPFARPVRSAATLISVLLGAITLVFAVGLSLSLHRVHSGFTRTDAVPVVVDVPHGGVKGKVVFNGGGAPDVDLAQLQATIASWPGTAHVVGVGEVPVRLVGAGDANVYAYNGASDWTGFPLVSGRWYAAPGEAVASSYLLRQTGHHVGDKLTVTGDDGTATVVVVGEFFDGRNGLNIITDAATVSGVGDTSPDRFEVAVTGDLATYVQTLQEHYGPESGIYVDNRTVGNDNRTFIVLDGLIATLALLLGAVAALGVLNTVVLTTRERSHEIGVLRCLGMTPTQVQSLVLWSTVLVGVVGGALAIPLGVALQRQVIPQMGAAAGTGVPESILDVYSPGLLAVLGLVGIAIAVLGAWLPAVVAARARPAHALRAE
jgi:putative ABC transport system permease protein